MSSVRTSSETFSEYPWCILLSKGIEILKFLRKVSSMSFSGTYSQCLNPFYLLS